MFEIGDRRLLSADPPRESHRLFLVRRVHEYQTGNACGELSGTILFESAHFQHSLLLQLRIQ
jgi:hypothetical protein